MQAHAGMRGGNVRVATVLLVEDDPIDAHAVELALWRGSAGAPQLLCAATMAEAEAIVRRERIDVVLLDLGLPDGNGVGNVRRLLAVCDAAPIVVLTGLDDDRVAMEAVRAGAQDYLVKGEIEPRGLETTMRFARERHRLASELEAARRSESELKDRFLSHVSHELRTPLMAVMQFTAILSDGIAGEMSSQQTEFLGIVQRNADQLKRMIGTLMDVTRAATGKLVCEPVRIPAAPVVLEAVESLRPRAEERRIELTFSAPPRLPDVVADRSRLLQVCENLIENAIKFSPDGSSVRVEVGVDRAAPDELHFVVHDSGPGIPADQLDRVFERLFQGASQPDTCRKGLGLGLHICREILNLHGGRIWAESVVGCGARFHFTVPVWSLARYVRQVAAVDDRLQVGIALVAVELAVRETVARVKGLEGAVAAVRQLMADCMLRFSDHVLPGVDVAGDRVVVFGLARTGVGGSSAILERIRAELGRMPRLGGGGIEWTVSACHRALAVGQPAEPCIEEITRSIEEQMTALERRSR